MVERFKTFDDYKVFTYEFAGRVYHVYQVMGVDAWNGYVFTYTALDGEYAEHLEAVSDILGRIKF